MFTISAYDLILPNGKRHDDFRNAHILDLRSPTAFYRGHIPESKSAPFHEITKHLPRNHYTPLIIYGDNHIQTHRYGIYLVSLGYHEVVLLAGGRESYCRTGLPIDHSLIGDPQFIRNALIIILAGGWGILSWLFPQYHLLIIGVFLLMSLCIMIPNPLGNNIFALFLSPLSSPVPNPCYLTKTGKIIRYTFSYPGTDYRSQLCLINDTLILCDPYGSRDIWNDVLSQYSFTNIIILGTHTTGNALLLSISHTDYQTKRRGPQSWTSSSIRPLQTDTLIHLGDYQIIQTHHTPGYCSYSLIFQGSTLCEYVGPLFNQTSRHYRMKSSDIVVIQGYINSLMTMAVRKIIGNYGIGGSDVFSYRDLMYDSHINWKNLATPVLLPLNQREQWRIQINQQGGYTYNAPIISYDRSLLTKNWVLDWRTSQEYRMIPFTGTWYFSPSYASSGDILLPPPTSPSGILIVMTERARYDTQILFIIQGWSVLFHTILSLQQPLKNKHNTNYDCLIHPQGNNENNEYTKENFVEKYQDGQVMMVGLINHDDWSWISSRLRLMGKKNNCTPVWLYPE